MINVYFLRFLLVVNDERKIITKGAADYFLRNIIFLNACDLEVVHFSKNYISTFCHLR